MCAGAAVRPNRGPAIGQRPAAANDWPSPDALVHPAAFHGDELNMGRMLGQFRKTEKTTAISMISGGEEGIRTLDTALDRITV